MNYSDISDQLLHGAVEGTIGHAIKRDEIQTTALYFIPVYWFVAFAEANELFLGIYEGTDLRLVGTRQIKFTDLTPESLREPT